MNRVTASVLIASLLGVAPTIASAAPTIQTLPSGNGHGYLVFDGNQKRVTDWLERPYRYLHPGQDPKGEGVPRRDLVYDLYFGARANGQAAWMSETTQTTLEYLDDSHIVRSVATVNGLEIESLFFLPFELSQNAMIAVARVRNTTSAPIDATLFFNPNVRMGNGRPEPSADGETITFNTDQATSHALEQGPFGNGTVIHQPLVASGGPGSPTSSTFDRADSSGQGYARVKAAQDLLDTPRAQSGNDLTLVWQKNLGTLAAGATASWGVALVYTNSDPAPARTELVNYLANRSAGQIVDDALAAHEAWRKPAPSGLSTDETHLWRQSESVLRMGQVREPWQETPKQKGHGMILASLPPGIWHVGWVRDAQYAIQALLGAGHLDEAKDALEFFLNAEAGSYQEYVGRPYRISVTRYFGDGQEESDWNADGPNPEYDGFGSFLWSARALGDANPDWLTQATRANEPHRQVFDDLIGAPLLWNLEDNGLIAADASIWEVHWNQRKQYAYTSITAARGLCDLSVMIGDSDAARATEYAKASAKIAAAIRSQLVDGSLMIASSKEELLSGSGYRDAAVLDAINFGLLMPGDPSIAATLDGMAPLKAVTGGYFRNDDGGGYDSQEWIFIDLRLAQALRNAGRTADADQLLAHVTQIGKESHYLLPELLNTNTAEGEIGAVSGAYPMVGFGAGAYMLALLHRSALYDEARACYATSSTTDGGTNPPPSDDSGCHVGTRPGSASQGDASVASTLLLLLAIGALHALRHQRRRNAASL